MVNEDLEAIVASWNRDTTKVALSSYEMAALTLMCAENKKDNRAVPFRAIFSSIRDTLDKGFQEKNAEAVLRDLTNKGCIFNQRPTPKGYEVFESEHSILSRIVIKLDNLHKTVGAYVDMAYLAREISQNNYGVIKHYLDKLSQPPEVVNVDTYQQGNKKHTRIALTAVGKRLSDYLQLKIYGFSTKNLE